MFRKIGKEKIKKQSNRFVKVMPRSSNTLKNFDQKNWQSCLLRVNKIHLKNVK